jgi:hypothetical protein
LKPSLFGSLWRPSNDTHWQEQCIPSSLVDERLGSCPGSPT